MRLTGTIHLSIPSQLPTRTDTTVSVSRGAVWVRPTYPQSLEETMKNLYIGNMEKSTTEQDVRTAFATYGPVEVVTIIKDQTTGVPRGFGFVEMTADKDAQEAVLGLNG